MSGWLTPWRTGHSLASWVSDMIGPVHINLTVTIAPDSVALLAQLLKLVQPSAAPRAAAAPPPLPPAAATHIIDRPKLVWTPERLAVLRDMYPRGVPIDEMMAAANALPGPPVKRNQVSIKAAGIGLRRDPGPAVPRNLAPAPPPPTNTGRARLELSQQQQDLLRELFPTAMVGQEICDRLNELPGPVIRARHMYRVANRMGLVRLREMRFEHSTTRLVQMNVSRSLWTEERLAVLRAGYPAGESLDELTVAVNALPGNPITRGGVAVKAKNCELKRINPRGAPYRPRQVKPPAPPPVPRPAIPPPPPPVSWKPDAPAAAEFAPAPTTAISFGYPVETSGKQPATFAEVQAWAAGRRCHFDGANMDAVNRLRQMMRLPLLVVVS